MTRKYILISMEDEKAEQLANVLGNKTCRKILEFLSEIKDASEKDISDTLEMPINTVEYNLNKLIEVGLIEKTKNFFWSQKGKKIPTYKASNKSILISPKSKTSSKFNSVIPIVILSAIGAFIIKQFFSITKTATLSQDAEMAVASNVEIASKVLDATSSQGTLLTISQPFPIWGWFLTGVAFAILLFLIFNWRKL